MPSFTYFASFRTLYNFLGGADKVGLYKNYFNIVADLRGCAVHVDNIKSFICPTNAHNSYKTVKLWKSYKNIIVAPTCFGLHKLSSGRSQPVLRV